MNNKFIIIGGSIVIALLVIFACYTLWFIYNQTIVLPHEYAIYDGKGTGCETNSFCMTFKGVRCCDFASVIHQYFSTILLILIFLPYLADNQMVVLVIYLAVLAFIISFIIQYVLRRRNSGR